MKNIEMDLKNIELRRGTHGLDWFGSTGNNGGFLWTRVSYNAGISLLSEDLFQAAQSKS